MLTETTPGLGTASGTINIGSDNHGILTFGIPNVGTYTLSVVLNSSNPATEFHSVQIDDIQPSPSGQHAEASCYRDITTAFTGYWRSAQYDTTTTPATVMKYSSALLQGKGNGQSSNNMTVNHRSAEVRPSRTRPQAARRSQSRWPAMDGRRSRRIRVSTAKIAVEMQLLARCSCTFMTTTRRSLCPPATA